MNPPPNPIQVTTSKSLKLDENSSPRSPTKRLSIQTKPSKRFLKSKTIPIPEILDDQNVLEPTFISTLFSQEEKTEEQVKQIYDLIKHFSFFDAINSKFPGYSFKEPALLELCSKMKYEQHILDKTLFSQGESTNGKVYLIFSGEVSLLQKIEPIPVLQQEEEPQKESPNLGPSPGFSQFASSIFSEAGSPLLPRNQMKPKNHTYAPTTTKNLMSELDFLTSSPVQVESGRKAGEFVGDETLLTWEARQYTAITNGPCELLVLSRRDFHLTREKHDEKRKRVVSYLENFVPQFRANSTYQLLEELVCVMEEKVLERGANLVVEGEIGDKIYMMFDGTCEILKNVKVDESLNLTKTLVSVKQLLRVNPMYNDPVSICHGSKGALIGDEILFGGQESYNCSVRITSGSALVFSLQKDIFLEKFPRAVQNELSNLFVAKCHNYLSNLQKCLVKKYPQMDLAPGVINNTVGGKNFFANKIVLVPQKNAEMNLKTRVGMFRKDKTQPEESTSTATAQTPTGDLPLISSRKTKAKSKTLVNTDINSFQRSISPSPTHRQSVEPSSPLMKVRPAIAASLFEDLSEEEGEPGDYEFLKSKISRRYINSQTFGPSREYLTSCPVKVSRTLTEKGLTIRKPHADLKNSHSSIKLENSEMKIIDDNLQISPRSRAVVRTKTQKAPEESPKNKGLEVLESIKEIRTNLIGKEASTKEYEMAKRRLNKSKSKPSSIKLQPESDRDLSHEKRISMLLRPFKDKLSTNGTTGLEILSNKFKPLKDGRKTGSPRKDSILPFLEEHHLFHKGDGNSRSFEKSPRSAENLPDNWKIEVLKRKGGQTILLQERSLAVSQTVDQQQNEPVDYLIERVVVPFPKTRNHQTHFEKTKQLKHETNTAILKQRIKKVKRSQAPSMGSFSPKKVENLDNDISYYSSSRQNLSIKLPAVPQVFIQTLGSEKLKIGSFTSRK